MHHPGILTIIFRMFACLLQSNRIHDNFHQVMDPLAPTVLETCTMALIGLFSYVLLPQKRVGAFGRKAMHCFNGCGFWLRTPFFLFLFFWFCRCFYFSANRPSVESFITDFPFAGPEPWHLGEPTSAFWRRSNIPQIKEITDFRITNN